jgi:hypothetical protein
METWELWWRLWRTRCSLVSTRFVSFALSRRAHLGTPALRSIGYGDFVALSRRAHLGTPALKSIGSGNFGALAAAVVGAVFLGFNPGLRKVRNPQDRNGNFGTLAAAVAGVVFFGFTFCSFPLL